MPEVSTLEPYNLLLVMHDHLFRYLALKSRVLVEMLASYQQEDPTMQLLVDSPASIRNYVEPPKQKHSQIRRVRAKATSGERV